MPALHIRTTSRIRMFHIPVEFCVLLQADVGASEKLGLTSIVERLAGLIPVAGDGQLISEPAGTVLLQGQFGELGLCVHSGSQFSAVGRRTILSALK